MFETGTPDLYYHFEISDSLIIKMGVKLGQKSKVLLHSVKKKVKAIMAQIGGRFITRPSICSQEGSKADNLNPVVKLKIIPENLKTIPENEEQVSGDVSTADSREATGKVSAAITVTDLRTIMDTPCKNCFWKTRPGNLVEATHLREVNSKDLRCGSELNPIPLGIRLTRVAIQNRQDQAQFLPEEFSRYCRNKSSP